MISSRSHPASARRSPARRVLSRTLCAAAVATIAWGASGVTVSAAPAVIDAPLATADVAGLSVGARGAAVTTLQQALLDAGVPVGGGADGIFGPATRDAVIAFQEANGLAATGDVDAATAAALTGDPSSSGSANLAVGARGDAVRELQEKLSASGVFVAGGADGVFGPATSRAVTQYQRWNGLAPTGIVDAATAASLDLGAATTAPPAPEPAAPDDGYVGLAVGARGDRVVELQRALQSTGLVVRGGADGVFGPATASAVKAFQSVNGIAQTGAVTARGAEILGLGTAAVPETTPPADPSQAYVGLSVGSSGALVTELQQALLAAGVTVRGGADGAFGPATRSALASYQGSVGLSSSGVVDATTADKLGLGTAGAPETPATPATASDNPYVGMTIGAQGDRVTELQNALQSTGLVVRGGADGVFGPATASALKAFQSVNGIAQSGVVTERGAGILRLGTGQVGITNPNTGADDNYGIERFPIQGLCFFGDTWHAPRGGGRLHVGTDFIADEGKLLYAVADGEITKLFWDQPGALAGNGIRLTAPDGTYFIYLHLLGFAPGIEVGTKVKAGDVIGFNGNTGSSSTAHLHFEIHPGGGAAVNPYPVMKAMDDCRNTTPRYQSSFA